MCESVLIDLQAVAGSRDTGAKATGVQGGAYPAKHEQGYTSGTATDADDKVSYTHNHMIF